MALRRAHGNRPGDWGPGDYDMGRIFLQTRGAWIWGVDFMLTGRNGTVESRDDAMATHQRAPLRY